MKQKIAIITTRDYKKLIDKFDPFIYFDKTILRSQIIVKSPELCYMFENNGYTLEQIQDNPNLFSLPGKLEQSVLILITLGYFVGKEEYITGKMIKAV